MSILAANSQNNRSSSNPYMTADFNSGNEKVGHFDCTSIMSTLNEIDDKNIRVMFKQAKDPVELAFAHIDSQPLQKIATNAIKEMYRQVGTPEFDEKGMIKKGLIIRHLVLPNCLENTKQILKWINENIDSEVYISVMTQYFPTYRANEYPEINRKITEEEYKNIEDYIYDLDIENRLYARLFRRK